MGFLAALVALASPILARVLVSLGFSVVTIGGVALAVDQIKAQVLAGIGSGPAAGVQLAGLAGVWDGLGMVFGAVTFAVSIWGITGAKRLLGV